jgi:hypothetical protein
MPTAVLNAQPQRERASFNARFRDGWWLPNLLDLIGQERPQCGRDRTGRFHQNQTLAQLM